MFGGFLNFKIGLNGVIKARNLSSRVRQSGFTLIELLVVTAIIGILAVLGLPYMHVYMLKGDLSQAQPYLMQIAAKERIYKLRSGRFYISVTNQEQELEDNLGVDLRDAGDFCFMVVCKALCTNGTAAVTSVADYVSVIKTGDPPIEFEVWAVLRAATAASVTGPGGSCTIATSKLPPQGWVQADTSQRGGEGRIVVLRYPSPGDGIDGSGYDWSGGASYSNALAN